MPSTPLLNLVVIRAADIDASGRFYSLIGLTFERERHGSGPEHLTFEHDGVVLEIYPRSGENDSTLGVRLGFKVASVSAALEQLAELGAPVVSPVEPSPWGLRAVVKDPDGHKVELTETVATAVP